MPGGGARCIRVRPCSATCRLSLTAPSAFRPFDHRLCTGRMLFSVFSVFCFPPIQVLFIAVGHGSFLKETSGGGLVFGWGVRFRGFLFAGALPTSIHVLTVRHVGWLIDRVVWPWSRVCLKLFQSMWEGTRTYLLCHVWPCLLRFQGNPLPLFMGPLSCGI